MLEIYVKVKEDMNAVKTTQLFQENKNLILLVSIISITLALLFYVFFMDKNIAQFFVKSPIETPKKNYPVLDKKLNQVISNPSPAQAAKDANLAIDDKEVKVLITLKDESFIFTDVYGTEELRYGKFIQASVKLNKLEELAKNPKIESIQAPEKASGPPPPFQK